MNSWPVTGEHDDKYAGEVVIYFAKINTGVMVFCEADWKRGEVERDARATGHVGTRLLRPVVRIARSRTTFQDECYPNIESAEIRWPGITEQVFNTVLNRDFSTVFDSSDASPAATEGQ